MIEGNPHYTFDDGTPVLGPLGKALSAAEFCQLDLAPITGESLFADGSPQRFVLRRQEPLPDGAVEAPSPTLSEKLAAKLSSGSPAPNGPTAPPTIETGIRSSKRKDTIRDAVLAHAREHPEWSAKDISKVVPRAASVIQRILDAELRNSKPEGTV